MTFFSDQYGVRYGHSPESWKALWHKVFSEIKGAAFQPDQIDVQASMSGFPGVSLAERARIGGYLFWSVYLT